MGVLLVGIHIYLTYVNESALGIVTCGGLD